MTTQWILDYNGTAFTLALPPEESAALPYSSFYKLSLRRYIERREGALFIGKSTLTYPELKRLEELCGKECRKRGAELTVSQALEAHITQREYRLESRARLGLELKNREKGLNSRFQAYRTALGRAMARPLRERQLWDSFFMCMMGRSANFSVPGSGKTASVLGMYAYLKESGQVRRLAVVCPKNAFGSWMDEFSLCFGQREELRALNLQDPRWTSAAARRSALRYDSGNANLILVNYEAAGGVLEELIPLVREQTLLVFDEVHKVKRVGGEYAGAALALAAQSTYTVAMTGTPIPNSYLDLYNLLHILSPEEYQEQFGFSLSMLQNPSPEEAAAINRKLQPFFCRTTKDQLEVPPAQPDILLTCPASREENRLLELLQAKYRGNKLALFLRILQMESNPRMLLNRLDLEDFRDLLDDGTPEPESDPAIFGQELRRIIGACPPSVKLRRCVRLAEELVHGGKPVIVWCVFVDSIRGLSAALEERGIKTRCIYGAVPLEERQEILEAFKAGRFQVLLTNPHVLAESVSLHSICHDAVYYEYSYNLVHLLQSKDRIHRLGLPEGQYTQYTYLQVEYQTEKGPWSMERAVYQRLQKKEQTMLEAIGHSVLEVLPTSEEDLEMIFKPLFSPEHPKNGKAKKVWDI